jgi:hypothetical protein
MCFATPAVYKRDSGMSGLRIDRQRTSFEALGYRVKIENGLARVYRNIAIGGAARWKQVAESPYHLPVLELELGNPRSSLSMVVQAYELATGRTDLRDAITQAVPAAHN